MLKLMKFVVVEVAWMIDEGREMRMEAEMGVL